MKIKATLKDGIFMKNRENNNCFNKYVSLILLFLSLESAEKSLLFPNQNIIQIDNQIL